MSFGEPGGDGGHVVRIAARGFEAAGDAEVLVDRGVDAEVRDHRDEHGCGVRDDARPFGVVEGATLSLRYVFAKLT